MWQKIGGTLKKRIEDIAVVLLFACWIASVIDLGSRFTVGYSVPWSHRVSIWLMEIFVFLLCGSLIWEHSHIKVTLISDRIKGQARKIVIDWGFNIINILMCLFVLWAGMDWMLECYRLGFKQQVGMWIIEFWPVILITVVLGMSIALVFSIVTLIYDVKIPIEKKER